jgi:hypothetical protein
VLGRRAGPQVDQVPPLADNSRSAKKIVDREFVNKSSTRKLVKIISSSVVNVVKLDAATAACFCVCFRVLLLSLRFHGSADICVSIWDCAGMRSCNSRNFPLRILDVAPGLFRGVNSFSKVDSGAIESALRQRLQLLQFTLLCVHLARSAIR